MDKKSVIDFTYPDGYKKVADTLDMLPEDQREMMLFTFIVMMLYQ